MPLHRPILILGATGYVGGRLIPRLLSAGYTVRAMGRSVEKMACRPWAGHPLIQLVQGDVLDLDSLERACRGCGHAFYLVHAMIAQGHRFAEIDRQSALNMRAAAERSGLEQIIYLGGLGEINHPHLSAHLASRHEVGDILQAGTVPATVLRAAMILGSGSASFEILRYLVERLPVMITPRWVQSPTQPIAIQNVLDYFIGCLENPAVRGGAFDIGGPEVLSYGELIRIYARQAGLGPRWIIPVPVLTPGLSARWIHLVTPVPAAIARPLTEGLSVPTVCKEQGIRKFVPVNLIPCRQAIATALDRALENQVDTCWSDAGQPRPPEWAYCGDADYAGGTILNCAYRLKLEAPSDQIWPVVAAMGGQTGYYFGNWLWRLRGWLDRWAGGVGLRRGRRHPSAIGVGDALDFWRVLTARPPHRLTLLAEMKVPGEAILDIQVQPLGHGQSELRLISHFLPRGLWGLIYWYALYPFHVWIFKGMARAMARAAGVLSPERPRRFDPRQENSCALVLKRNTHEPTQGEGK
ncbi:MAG: SDR family oxidoreductase [Desulfobacteraceae bacterium]|nr:SDR family oxidoreductase [Desulfobacteraceae bacterium]